MPTTSETKPEVGSFVECFTPSAKRGGVVETEPGKYKPKRHVAIVVGIEHAPDYREPVLRVFVLLDTSIGVDHVPGYHDTDNLQIAYRANDEVDRVSYDSRWYWTKVIR